MLKFDMSRSGDIGELFRYRGKQQEKQLKVWCSLPLVFGAACKGEACPPILHYN